MGSLIESLQDFARKYPEEAKRDVGVSVRVGQRTRRIGKIDSIGTGWNETGNRDIRSLGITLHVDARE